MRHPANTKHVQIQQLFGCFSSSDRGEQTLVRSIVLSVASCVVGGLLTPTVVGDIHRVVGDIMTHCVVGDILTSSVGGDTLTPSVVGDILTPSVVGDTLTPSVVGVILTPSVVGDIFPVW